MITYLMGSLFFFFFFFIYSLQPQNWGVEDRVLSSSIVSFTFLSACSVKSFMTMIIYFNSKYLNQV